MDTIAAIKLAVEEWIAEDPQVRRKLLIQDPALTRILKRADEILRQHYALRAEQFRLIWHVDAVDSGELILSDR